MKKWIAGTLVLAMMVVAGVYLYWNKPHRSVAGASAIEVSAVDLFLAYQQDETAANAKYLNQVVKVNGVINSVTRNAEGKTVVMLESGDSMFGINCTLEKEGMTVVAGDTVAVTGICTGYLSDVVIVQGILSK